MTPPGKYRLERFPLKDRCKACYRRWYQVKQFGQLYYLTDGNATLTTMFAPINDNAFEAAMMGATDLKSAIKFCTTSRILYTRWSGRNIRD